MKDFSVNSSIVISAKHGTRSFKIPLLMIIAFVGCISMLDVCITMIAPEFNKPVFWSISIITIIAVLFLSLLPKHLHLTGFIPLLAGVGYAAVNRHVVEVGAKIFCNAYYSAAYTTETKFFDLIPVVDEKAYTTIFMCCISVILCSLISRLVIRRPLFIFYFALTFIPVEFGLYHGMEMRLLSMMLLIVTWFAVLGVQLSVQKGHAFGVRGVRTSNTANCGIAAAAVTAIAVVISFTVCSIFGLTSEKNVQDKRREVRSEIENFNWNDIAGSLADLSVTLGFMDDPDERELGTKNSIKYQNEDEVKVTLSDIPEQGFYLKNYTGSVYEDNMWYSFSDKEWESSERLSALFTRFECVPQILPFMNNQTLYGRDKNAQITIEPLKHSAPVLQPYASYTENGSYRYDYGCYVKDKDKYSFDFSLAQDFTSVSQMYLNEYYLPTSGFNFSDSVTSSFFEQLGISRQQEILTISSIVPPYLNKSKYTTQTLQSILAENFLYRDFAYDSYTFVEDTKSLDDVFLSLPANLIETGNSGSASDILNSIRMYLDEQCEYTLSPGRTPSTRDFVNYFLLENNAGYCMHYATAGTILARHFGIPARYCEGYIVSSDMMEKGKKNSDGSVTFSIPDSASHAWCEYYLDGYGWIPFEFTPGYYSLDAPEEPVRTEISTTTDEQTAVTSILTEKKTELQTTTVSSTSLIYSGTNNNSTAKNDADLKTSGSALKTIFSIFGIIFVLAAAVFLIIALRHIRIKNRNKKFRSKDKKAAVISIYSYLCRILQIEKIDSGNMQMLDFAEFAKKSLNDVELDGSGANEIILAALAADMGGKIPSNETLNACADYVNGLAQQIINRKNPFKKLIFKYIFHLI